MWIMLNVWLNKNLFDICMSSHVSAYVSINPNEEKPRAVHTEI